MDDLRTTNTQTPRHRVARRLSSDPVSPGERGGVRGRSHYAWVVSDVARSEGSAPVARRSLSVEQRRTEILEATRRVVLTRGFGHTRIADVAAELGVSTGLIHYHFAAEDILLAEMLRVMAAADIRRLEESVELGYGDPIQRLDQVIQEYLPSIEHDESWVLWIDAWGDALRNERLRTISEELDTAWAAVLEDVIVRGVNEGRFRTPDAAASSWRLACAMDGLGVQLTLHTKTMTHTAMIAHARQAASNELRFDRSLLPG